MSHTVHVSGHRSCPAEDGETLLDALLRAGISVRYGCRRGKCSTCKHLLVEGDVDESEISAYALLDEERDEGLTLLCKARVKGDCSVELITGDDEDGLEPPPPSTLSAEVVEVRQVGPTLWRLAATADVPLDFLAGQYVEMGVPHLDGETRSYSLAVPPSASPDLAFIVRRHELGSFSGALGTSIAPGAVLELRGPFGDMYLRPSSRPVVLVAAGSGVAPLLSIIDHLAETQPTRRVRLAVGARTRGDLIAEQELAAWAEALDDLQAHLTLTAPDPSDRWTGPTGRVQGLLARALGEEWDVDAYVCGPPALCADAELFLEARGVPPHRIHTDGFYAAG